MQKWNLMKKILNNIVRPVWAAVALLIISTNALAADCPKDIKAVTAKDADVSVEVLEFLVKPLTKCELEAEAQAWLALLQSKVAEISEAEIAALYKKEELKKTKEMESTLEDVKQAKEEHDREAEKESAEQAKAILKEEQEVEKKSAQDVLVQKAIKDAAKKASEADQPVTADAADKEAKVALKNALIRHATNLMAERTALIDLFNVVLAELELKGGDIKEYNSYIKAVSGIKVDVTDASATWTTITGWLSSPEGGIRWVINLGKFIVILVVSYFLSIVAGKAAKRLSAKSPNFSTLLSEFLVTTARRLVLFVGFFIALSALEINIGPVLAIIGAAGFVIALALQNSLSNFASGLLMLAYRPFDMGEVVNVAGVLGKVEAVNLLTTQLRTPDNQVLVIPNNSVWGGVITNITGITQRRIDLVFGIGYDDDIDTAQKILEDIVNEHELVLKDPEPVVKLHELGESSVNFICRPWVKPDDYWKVYWDITREVKQRFDANGVSIPFPQRDVHLYQQTA